MRFTLRQVEYFIATAETGSITLASERISISQPSISAAISQLEAELGTQLFLRRHAQGLSLTPAGRELLTEAKRLVEQANRLYHTASEVTDTLGGTLSVGCLLTFAPMVLPAITQGFAADHPGVRVAPEVADHAQLLHRLERAELDVALSYDLEVPDGFDFEPLVELAPYAMVAQTDPLAGQAAVTLAELAEQELILLDLPLSRDYFMGLFAREGLTPRIAARLQQFDVLRTMVANRFGYSIANARPRNSVAMDGRDVVAVRIAGAPQGMTMGLLRVARQRPTRLVTTFVDYCRDLISDSYVPGMVAPSDAPRRRG